MQWVITGTSSGQRQYIAIDADDGDLVTVDDIGKAAHFDSEKAAKAAIEGCEWGHWVPMESPLYLMTPPRDVDA